MDSITKQHINNIINNVTNDMIQQYYDSDVFNANENNIVNLKLRECFYIHGWDRTNKKICLAYQDQTKKIIYRAFDEAKLKQDLQTILEKFA